MKQVVVAAIAILCAVIPLTTNAQTSMSSDQTSGTQTSAPSKNATGQGIKKDAAKAKQSIKNGAAKVKQTVKKDATKLKRKVAIAQCNDGRYSYTRQKTCNHHGGVKTRLR